MPATIGQDAHRGCVRLHRHDCAVPGSVVPGTRHLVNGVGLTLGPMTSHKGNHPVARAENLGDRLGDQLPVGVVPDPEDVSRKGHVGGNVHARPNLARFRYPEVVDTPEERGIDDPSGHGGGAQGDAVCCHAIGPHGHVALMPLQGAHWKIDHRAFVAQGNNLPRTQEFETSLDDPVWPEGQFSCVGEQGVLGDAIVLIHAGILP